MAENDDRTPIGMTPDGNLRTLEPGQEIPKPKILTPEGDELTPDELEDEEKPDDLSDLDGLEELIGRSEKEA